LREGFTFSIFGGKKTL